MIHLEKTILCVLYLNLMLHVSSLSYWTRVHAEVSKTFPVFWRCWVLDFPKKDHICHSNRQHTKYKNISSWVRFGRSCQLNYVKFLWINCFWSTRMIHLYNLTSYNREHNKKKIKFNKMMFIPEEFLFIDQSFHIFWKFLLH